MKYAPLGAFLDSLDLSEKPLTLREIEHVLGFRLPPTAHQRSFWSNTPKGKAQAVAGWLSVGWRVKTVRRKGDRITQVVFRRAPEAWARIEPQVVALDEELWAELSRPDLSSPQAFHASAAEHMMNHHGAALQPGRVRGIDHRFDYVSEDGSIVGEMRLFKTVPPRGVHSATLASISEAVFLLQHAPAKTRFLVFGGDRRVPETWLARHGPLATDIAFWHIAEDGHLAPLQPSPLVRTVQER